MKKSTLSSAITLALAVGSISVASATSTTMYNTFNNTGTVDPAAGGTWAPVGQTDGWANGAVPSAPTGTIPSQAWLGSTGAAFGYTGAHLNWGAEFTGGGTNTATISSYDAKSKYGTYADIDAAKGAWSDASQSEAFGWRHDLDLGLFKTDTAGTVNLSISGILLSGTDYGFTIFKGMDTVTTYNHHGSWNRQNMDPITVDNGTPFNQQFGPSTFVPMSGGLTVADLEETSVGGASPTDLNTISFEAEAGQLYSIFIGGYRNGNWTDTNDGYALQISQAPAAVPVPAAAWLFGTGLIGMIGARRRKLKV